MRTLDFTEGEGRIRTDIQTTRIFEDTRKLQAQREHEQAVVFAKLRGKDRQIAALTEEREKLLFLFWVEREQHSSERRAVERERARAKTEWMRRLDDRERHIQSTVLAVAVMKLTLEKKLNQIEEEVRH